MTGKPDRTPDNDQIYRYLRSEIHFEYSIINARVTWLVTSQAFLFMPLAIGIPVGSGASGVADSVFFPFIPYLGIAVCLLALVGIIGAVTRVNQWKRKYAETLYAGEDGHGTFAVDQPRSTVVPLMGQAASIGIPLVLTTAWIVVRIWPPS